MFADRRDLRRFSRCLGGRPEVVAAISSRRLVPSQTRFRPGPGRWPAGFHVVAAGAPGGRTQAVLRGTCPPLYPAKVIVPDSGLGDVNASGPTVTLASP